MGEITIARREFLKTGGALVVGFALIPYAALGQTAAAGKSLAADQVDSFLVIGRDGGVTLYSGKVDIGTGTRAAYRQIVAEELDVPVQRIAMIEGDTALCPDQGGTGGSTGIVNGGMQIRQAAATARQALLALASTRLSVGSGDLRVSDGVVRSADGRSIGYGELIPASAGTGSHFDVELNAKAPLKNPDTYQYVGQPLARPDLPAKMTGRHAYMQDFRIPGMLHARVIRPHAVGATLTNVDEGSIAGIPGARVIRIKNFVAVVAGHEWDAIRAARALKLQWTGGGGLPGSERVHAAIRTTEVARDEQLIRTGDTDTALRNAARKFTASYEWPAQSHASMGPSCAVADYRPGSLTVWSSSQGTHGLRRNLARDLGIPAEQVRVVYMDGAGSYGGNGSDDAAADAALISRALQQPVRVQWMREDEHAYDPKGPPQLLDLKAALDANGNIAAWETEAWLPENTPNLRSRPLLAFLAAGIPQPVGQSVAQVQGNAYPSYDLPNMTATVHWLKTTPLRPSNLRAPGKPGNSYAVECFIDELAAAAKRDPLEFRLAHLKDQTGIAILKRIAERMNWQARPSPNPARSRGAESLGRGVAYVHYKHTDNRLGLGIEVAVNRNTGTIRVTRAVCVYEAGLMINPDAVRAQVEGNILQAISRTLHEEVQFDQNGVTSTDWRSYPILTFPEVPALEVELIGSVHDKPLGAGEAASAPVPAAVGNAVFDAIGVRLRKAPLTATRVRDGLAGQT
ncbi:MAG: xanthine dehydrogenase family protein molybdopterin-binding subunit [Alphaproteobacteria bacterium]|nr:xanthine dehydrogenase family protein molybdopterin-binding subunit [Alphaproteobacteria bacterium]